MRQRLLLTLLDRPWFNLLLGLIVIDGLFGLLTSLVGVMSRLFILLLLGLLLIFFTFLLLEDAEGDEVEDVP